MRLSASRQRGPAASARQPAHSTIDVAPEVANVPGSGTRFRAQDSTANVANATINVQFRSFEATSLPAQVTTVTAAAIDASHQKLTWTAVPGATAYLVQRKALTDSDYLDLITNVAGTTYTDATVQTGQSYLYRVIAVNSGGASQGFATPVSVTT